MAIYESIFILDSLMPPKEIDAVIERAKSIISSHNGNVRKVEKWGKKRLAYEIQKKQYGFYVSLEFESESGNIPHELSSDYNYNDKVLRYLTYSYDKRKLKTLANKAELEEKVSSSDATAPVVKAETVETPAVEVKEETVKNESDDQAKEQAE